MVVVSTAEKCYLNFKIIATYSQLHGLKNTFLGLKMHILKMLRQLCMSHDLVNSSLKAKYVDMAVVIRI